MVVLLLVGMVGLSTAQAAPAPTEKPVKAAFLYKFGLYVDWPDSAFPRPDSPVVIGVAATDDFVQLVRNIARDRKIDGRPIEVRPVRGGDLENLHILFVARSREDRLESMLDQVSDQPTLVVTESGDGLESGAVIDFALEDDRVRFDVNLYTAERRDLQLSAQLLRVARFVRGAP